MGNEHPDKKYDRQTHTNLTGSGLFGVLTMHGSMLSSRSTTRMVCYGVAIVLVVSHGLNKQMVPFVVLFNWDWDRVKLYDRFVPQSS